MEMEDREAEIAVVGMSCRFPGARGTDEFWSNLCAGVESISFFGEEELLRAGIPESVVRDPSYVRAYGAIPEAYAFDAAFFGVNPTEAQVMDPQQRVFLECAWSALEDAGYDPARFLGSVGVYAGSGSSPYLWRVLRSPDLLASVGGDLAKFGCDRDFLTTRVSYKLGLHGPSVVVQTACSTSLVAIHLACQSLLNRECDLALAGGATISPDQECGYLHQEGGIVSPDGHCRAFDARAAGTVSGSGAGVVVLKRMVEALRDGDTIHAVIKGSATNNDGAEKVGFSAPSVKWQARVIAEAQAVAGVDPATVSYVEAHGTGTALGDPIEIAALTEVFSAGGRREERCALGAVKTNIGHVDAAAGVAGFIKTVLALENRALPPTLHFERANPETGLEDSPFEVNTELREWCGNGTPRRAGVSSFGMGGTNAHVVLEEAPEPGWAAEASAHQLLVLSARSDAALERMRRNLAGHLERHPGLALADVAYTLQEGRAVHPHRWAAAVRGGEEAREALAGGRTSAPRRAPDRAPAVAFLFPGQGTQYAGMARELYGAEPVFRREIDHCADLLAGELEMNLRSALFPAGDGAEAADALLQQTRFTQPALFATEYALAKLWMSWGVKPAAMLGHSVGEYVAACVAGVFALEDALRLVVARGRMMQELPAGAMLAVPLPEEEVRALLPERLSLAAVNSAAHCVVSGDTASVAELEGALAGRGVAARRLHTSHAFHSASMDPILDAFADEVRRARPGAPSIPFLSNVTGDWITAEQAADPAYWVRHLRETVRFADGVGRLLEDAGRVLLEVGPGDTLGTFTRRHGLGDGGRLVVSSLPRAGREDAADRSVLEAAGSLWTAGVEVDWSRLRGGGTRRRVPLPTYPFERTEYRLPAGTAPISLVAPSPAAPARAVPPAPAPSRPHPLAGTPPAAGPVPPGRPTRTAAAVAAVFAKLLGVEPEALDPDRSFLELGADSLLLMQASRTIESDFGVRVPFRKLLEGLSTVRELAAHVEREAPAHVDLASATDESAAAPSSRIAAGAAPLPGNDFAAPAPGGTSAKEIVAQQLATLQTYAVIMQRQLDLLCADPEPRGTVLAAPVAPPAASTVPPRAHAGSTAASHGPHRPVSQTIDQGGGFTERQARHFEELVRRYTARTRSSREYAAENRAALADNRASLNFRMATKELMYPIVGERSQGSRLWDVDGNEYVDFTIGFGVHFFGHRPAFIMEAVEEQLRRGIHLGPQSDLAGPVARLFRELTGTERVTFCNTGSEAVMTALRIARTATGRDRVVLFEGSYHGCFDGILARPGGGGGAAPRSRPVAPGTPQGMVDDVVVLPYGTPEALEYLRSNAGVIAAVLVEPVQSRNPEFHPVEFLRELRALTERSGIVLVFDEMITGLRLQVRGAQGWYGVDADLATYGKVIGGGFPLGIVAGRARFMDAIDGGHWQFGDDSYPAANQTFFAGTFCKHPVTMAAAYAVLRHLQERGEALYDEMNARTARLVGELRRLFEEEGVGIRVPSCASLFQFRFEPGFRYGDLLFYHVLERGVYIWEGRACFLSTAHTDDDCDRLVRALRESIHALRQGGFLPDRPGPGGSASDPRTVAPEAWSADPVHPFPLTPAQRQIWVHAQLGDDASRAYNEQIVFGLRGGFDAEALRAAVRDLMAHHEALRTVFDPSGEVQRVAHDLPAPLRLGGAEDEDGAAGGGLAAAMGEAVREVFDLAAGPPFRVHVHRRAPDFHVVQLVVHHLVADGFSAPLLKRDLVDAYRARAAGRAPRLPEAMRFSEYAALLAAHAAAHADREAEWLERFRDAVPLALPADRQRPRFPTNRAATECLRLGAPLAAGVRELGRRQGCTLFATLLTGLLATLHRVAAQDDLVVGIPSAGRPFPGSGSLVGDCADLLPLRSRTRETQELSAFLREVRGWLLDAFEHEVFAYTRLQEKLRVPRGPGDPPLVTLVFNLEPPGQDTGIGATEPDGIRVEAVGASAPFAKFDLTIDTLDLGEEIEVFCLFNRDLFERGTIQRLLGQLERVLEQAVAGPGVLLRDLELLGGDERRLVLEEWNRTRAEFPADRCLHHLFEERAALAPDAPAAIHDDRTLTYGELDRRANRLANHLRRQGVGPEVRVGICLERGPDLVAAILGVLKAGGAYVPLDPDYPAERLARMLADSGTAVVLTQEALRGTLPAGSAVRVVSVDGARLEIEAGSADSPAARVEPRNLAYVIFTSGSTGRPKGIALAHRGVVNNLVDLNRGHRVGKDDRVLLLSSLSFDMSVYETLGILAAGGAVVIPAASELRDPSRWTALARRHSVTVWNSAPALLGMLVDHLDASPADAPPSLRLAFLGGDWVPVSLPDRLRAHVPGMEVVVMGGATEASIHSIIYPVRATDLGWTSIPYGVPMANQRAYVLDEWLRPVPIGVAGELYLGGTGLARGYTGRPDLTAERFLPDVHGRDPGARMYRTGDRARWLADGNVELLGRMDAQVKVRGFRIEPGEIEAVLRRHPRVEKCAVVAREDRPGDRRLVAYVVGGADAEALRAHLRRELPEYMVPAAFVAMESLPLSPNGKVDRRALPAPEHASAEERYVVPRTPVEEVLAGIWAEVLKVERVGVHDDFFELGGHSLLATRVVSRVREVFAVELPVRALFDAPTLAGLAEQVEELRRAGLPQLPPVVPVERAGPLPLSFAQERLWFLDRLQPGSAFYNVPVALKLGGALHRWALERGLGEVVRRHESLRTTFVEAEGSPVQVVAPFDGFTLSVVDLSGLAERGEAKAGRLVSEEAIRPFDLTAGPLFRARLLRLKEDEHVLLLSMHHIVSDGWSIDLLFRELSALYGAYREGRESPLEEAVVQYADYAVWQREHMDGEVLDRQVGYWTEQLAGAPALLELPTDRPRPAVQTYRGAYERIELPVGLLVRLKALSKRGGATLYMVLLGAFQVLLSKYSGSEDVVVGSPIAGRTRREVEGLIGFFVNSLVLRTDLSGGPSFLEVLRRVREVTLGAYEHQEVPFERLVEALRPERSLSHSPLFQVIFEVVEGEGTGGELPGLRVGGASAEPDTAKFDLSLELAVTSRGLRGGLNYNTDLFDRATAQRMLTHLGRALEQIADGADVSLTQLSLIGAEERAQVLEWSHTEHLFPGDACIHELFQAQAQRTPQATAVVSGEGELTYRELDERVSRLAHQLRSRGVGPEVVVGLRLERTPQMLVVVLGVLAAGAAYLPIDPATPPERVALLLEDAGARLLLTPARLLATTPTGPWQTLALDTLPLTSSVKVYTATAPGVSSRNAAYVIYTSGSTGTPKGVVVEHRSLVNHTHAAARLFGIGPGDRVLQFASLSFDTSAEEIFSTLLAGATLVLRDEGPLEGPAAFLGRIAGRGVTVLGLPTAYWHELVAAMESGTAEIPACVRVVVIGGEHASPERVAAWHALSGGRVRLLNGYGPTEATVGATFAELTAGGGERRAAVSIGSPVPNARAYVVDAVLHLLPVGVPGELCVGGAGVARGYLARPSLTAERFVPDPFSPERGTRMYRTGDRVRWLPKGELEFLGRLDEQVKIRGFRIEPGEVENVLAAVGGVREARVVVREDEPGEKRLVAYLVGEAEMDGLRARLRAVMPEYLVPHAFVALDRLPLTPSGKLDRKALPAPAYVAAGDRYVAPRTPVEEVLAGIWTELLRVDRVGVEENFFELGGHSLVATRVVSRIRELFSAELPLRALFEGPTVAEMARRVEEVRHSHSRLLLPPIIPVERVQGLPLSPGQERLWFVDRMEGGSPFYHVPEALRYEGVMDRDALERALGEIVRRHEVLRTTFQDRGGVVVQVIAPFRGLALPVEDLAGLAEPEREREVRRCIREAAGRSFDLSAGPLFRALLLRVAEEDHVLVMCTHHIVSDGWSMDVLLRELSVLYAAYRDGGESPLRELPVQYADYAVWQREQMQSDALERQFAYWKAQLAGAPVLLELPTDRPRPAVRTYQGAHEWVELSGGLPERLQALARREGVTLYMVLLGAFQVLLARYGGCEDVVVGSPVAGRTRSELEGLIGFFVNTLVLRMDLGGDPSFREVLRRVRKVMLDAYECQEVPFEKLVAEFQPERSLSHSPLFQTVFTMNTAHEGVGGLSGLGVRGVDTDIDTTRFDLTLDLTVHPRRIGGVLEYGTALFERSTIARMRDHLLRVLEQTADDAHVRLSCLELIGPEERTQVVEEWNRTERPYPREVCIHELFEAQVEARPEEAALVWGEEELTYRQVEARANQLAHHLAGLGVHPESRVGVLLERGPELIVTLLAILKAGGCYVPLDPGYPAARLELMLADAGAGVLVTRRTLATGLHPAGTRAVFLDEPDALASESSAAPRSGASAQNLAYIVYTSGSTGAPKGVMVCHRQVVQLVRDTDYVKLGPGDRIAQASSASFDAITFEAWGALTNGATLVGVDREVLLSPSAMREFLREQRITTLYQTTALLNQLTREQPDIFAPLREVLFGGQAADAASVRRLLRSGRPERLLHMYGPTETTAWCSWMPLEHVAADALTVPVGRGTSNARIYILDAALQPTPLGVPGEAYVGGGGIVRGYLDRPGLTAERFLPDPFGPEPGARMYRTGDRLRWTAAGTLEFVGRLDSQVKIRGFRIEPGEVESAVSTHPGVREARVIVREDTPGEKRLVAYVVGAVEADELANHLRRSLPEYMVPGAFVVMESLPLTPNGKLDVRALPAPELSGEGDAYLAPRTAVEEVLAGIWAEVLGAERVGVRDDFFAMGGHSLLIMRLTTRVHAAFGVELPIRRVFESPTLAAMADEIQRSLFAEILAMPEARAERQLAELNSSTRG
jgi:amino acid adenylation domain-containing protein